MERDYKGYGMALASYVIWGVLPIYWKQLSYLGSLRLLSVRIMMTALCLIVFVHIQKNPLYLSYLKDSKIRLQLLVTSILIGLNWGIFVFAVGNGFVVQASLGYYINPLISMFLGIVLLKEHLSKAQKMAIGSALLGVVYLTLSYGTFPWISIVLAFSFGLYGFFKKTYQLDSLNSLAVEALYILPFVLIFIFRTDPRIWMGINGTLDYRFILIILAGIVTIVPLVLFAEGAKRIPLSAVGFLQYIAPTMMLVIGVMMYGESFTIHHGISFIFIWLGLVIYSVSLLKPRI